MFRKRITGVKRF